jgi:citrate lyase subunit beta / citryl-CoA lyase
MIDFVPRRSVLYMPGANVRAMEKAKTLMADSFIIDLEDAVAPREKAKARTQVVAAVNAGAFRGADKGHREVAVRINSLTTDWGKADIEAIRETSINAVALPKVETAEQIEEVAVILKNHPDIAIWAMIETPRGVLNVEKIVTGHPKLNVLVMGTSDLANDLRVPHTDDRMGLLYSLSKCVTVARAHGLNVIDGVHLDLQNDKGFMLSCEQARNLGFDGKSLIHPKQISTANRIFSPSKGTVEHAQQVIEAWKQAEKEGSGVVVVNGKLVENLHVAEAKRILAVVKAIELRQAS